MPRQLFRNHEAIDMNTRLRFALLAGSALAGFSLCLQPASAASSAADACAALMMNRFPAAIEPLVQEYPVDREGCLATAVMPRGFPFGHDRAGQGFANGRRSDHASIGDTGHGGASGTGHGGGNNGNGTASGAATNGAAHAANPGNG